MIVGLFLPPDDPNALEAITIEAVSDALNSGTAFDFDYEAAPQDVFLLHLSEDEVLCFSYDTDFGEDLDSNVEEVKPFWDFNDNPFAFYEPDFDLLRQGKVTKS